MAGAILSSDPVPQNAAPVLNPTLATGHEPLVTFYRSCASSAPLLRASISSCGSE